MTEYYRSVSGELYALPDPAPRCCAVGISPPEEPEPRSPLAERLRLARVSKRMSLRHAAHFFSLTPQALSKIEHGRLEPSEVTVWRAANLYGVNHAELCQLRGK